MANLFATTAQWLAQQRASHAAESITYSRGGSYSLAITAAKGRTEYDTINAYGLALKHRSQDWFITASALVFDGTTMRPQRGDRITYVSGDTTETYEVMPLVDGEDCYRLEPHGYTMRIHTRLIDTETPIAIAAAGNLTTSTTAALA